MLLLVALTGCESQAHAVGNAFSSVYERLASTASGRGASLIGIEDSAGDFTATNLEAAIAEMQVDIEAGGGTVYAWDPLEPQGSPHASSDLLNNSSIDAAWTDFDNGATTTGAETTYLSVTQTTHAGQGIAGYHRAVPAAATYRFAAYIALASTAAGTASSAGVFAGADLVGSPTTAAIVLCSVTTLGNGTFTRPFEMLDYTDWDTYSATERTLSHGGAGAFWVAMFVNTSANTYSCGWSSDGIDWVWTDTVAQSDFALNADPTRMGMGINNVATTYDVTARFLRFQVDETSDKYLPIGGFP